jgi:hypothetical protein
MDVLVAYASEVGFYLVNEYGDIICPHIFADYDDAENYCDKYGYNVIAYH